MPLNKTAKGMIIDLAKYVLQGVKEADPCRAECENELYLSIEERVEDFIKAVKEEEDD